MSGMSVRTEFVTNSQGKRVAVLLDVRSYARLKESAEELADIHAYDKTRLRVAQELKRGQFVTLAQHIKSKSSAAR